MNRQRHDLAILAAVAVSDDWLAPGLGAAPQGSRLFTKPGRREEGGAIPPEPRPKPTEFLVAACLPDSGGLRRADPAREKAKRRRAARRVKQ